MGSTRHLDSVSCLQRHYGVLAEVASGAAARALQITTLQLPENSVSPQLHGAADVRKNAKMF